MVLVITTIPFYRRCIYYVNCYVHRAVGIRGVGGSTPHTLFLPFFLKVFLVFFKSAYRALV